MSKKHSTSCYLIGVLLLGYLAFSIISIIAIHLNEIPFLHRSHLLRTSALCSAFGMLGSSMASIRKYYRVLITESNSNSTSQLGEDNRWGFGWTFYYLTRPILGATLGGLAFILVFVGFRVLSTSPVNMISSQGNMMLYVVSLLAGYAVSQVLDRLSDVATQVFDFTGGKQ